MSPKAHPDALRSPPGLFRRLGALFYDGLLVLAVLFLATALLLALRGGEAFPAGDLSLKVYLFGVVLVFFGWFWTREGQTLGMRAWKIRLKCVSGAKVSWRQAALRFLPALFCLGLSESAARFWPQAAVWVGWFSIGLFGLDFLWALVDPDKRCWHDLIAHTQMVSVGDAKNPA